MSNHTANPRELPRISLNSSSPHQSEDYLASPLNTLRESLNDPESTYVTLYDQAEAYSSLSRRIRLQAHAIAEMNKSHVVLSPLRESRTILASCLLRDVARCRLDPIRRGSISDDNLIFEGAERAQAFATLSQYALVFLSDIFLFPALLEIFSSTLDDFMRELLAILTSQSLPTPNAEKTQSLAMYALLSQRLPTHVLLRNKREIMIVLAKFIQSGNHSFVVDALKVLSCLIEHHMISFIEVIQTSYSYVLSALMKDNFDLKLQALRTLCSLVRVKLVSSNDDWEKEVGCQTRSFIGAQTTRYRSSPEGTLQDVLSMAIKSEDGKGPVWALLVIACLICLSGPDMFRHPHSMKLFLTILSQATGHRRSYVRTLQPHVWNCLVWSFSQLPVQLEDIPSEKLKDIDERAFLVLKQELKGGTATALAWSLFHRSPGNHPRSTSWAIPSALNVISNLILTSKEIQLQEGVGILSQLLSRPKEGTYKNTPELPLHELFTMSLLDSSQERMKLICNRLPRPDVCYIRPLSEDNISHHWSELIGLWFHILNVIMCSDTVYDEYSDQLMSIGYPLLRLDPVSGPWNISSTVHDKVVLIINEVMSETGDPKKQYLRLSSVNKLWSVLKRAYGARPLISLAETILTVILKRTFAFYCGEVQSIWGKLCADLASVGVPYLLHTVFVKGIHQGELEIQRQLWIVLGNSKHVISTNDNFDSALSFLAIPIGSWVMSPRELDIWTQTFQEILNNSRRVSMPPYKIVGDYLYRLGQSKIRMLNTMPGIISLLLPNISLDITNVLHQELIRTVNGTLSSSYPPSPEQHVVVLPLLAAIGRSFQSSSETTILELLHILKDSICLWIKDEKRVLLDHEYTNLIRDIYCAALVPLARLPLSIEHLRLLSPFLSSAFERIEQPPIGPLAFEQFWRATYHQDDSLKPFIPEELVACLKAWSDHCADSLGEGLPSFMTDSQRTNKSVVPDSQSSDKTTYPQDRGSSGHDQPVGSKRNTEQVTTLTPKRRRVENDSGPFKKASFGECIERSTRLQSNSTNLLHSVEASVATSGGPFLNAYIFPVPQGSRPFQTPRHRHRHQIVVPPTPECEVNNHMPPSSLASTPKWKENATRIINSDEVIDDSTEVCQSFSPFDGGRKVMPEKCSHASTPSHRSLNRSGAMLPDSSLEFAQISARPIDVHKNHTSASDRLGVLERAYTLVAHAEGQSQVPAEELARAARLVHEIGAKLNEQLSKKLQRGP